MGASTSFRGASTATRLSSVTENKDKYKLHRIGDSFNTLEDVQGALRRAGVESCNLIVGIDFTKSNECVTSEGPDS